MCKFDILFHLACIMVTVGIASWCCYQYSLNADFTIINFRRFNDDQGSIYPSVSLCLPTPCLDDELKKLDFNITCNDYLNTMQSMDLNIINGLKFNDKILQIDYENFTIQLNKYWLRTEVLLANKSTLTSDTLTSNIGSNILNPPYRGLTETSYKCYTFDTPYLQGSRIRNFRIHLNRSYPHLNSSLIAVHYPNQLMQSTLPVRSIAKDLDLNKNQTEYAITVPIDLITTINRRNKPETQCNADWKRDDVVLLEQAAASVNCRHPHINISHHLTPCSNISELSRFTWEHVRNYDPPCVQIITARFVSSWDEIPSKDASRIIIDLQFLVEKYKETSQVNYAKVFPIFLLVVLS